MTQQNPIELRCSKTSDGKLTAHTYINGKQFKEPGFSVNRGDEYAVVLLYQRVKKKYPTSSITVRGLDKHAMDEIKRIGG
ncbi:MAG: hypothetical protein AB1600_01995 [Bacteroidota bacterium]